MRQTQVEGYVDLVCLFVNRSANCSGCVVNGPSAMDASTKKAWFNPQ